MRESLAANGRGIALMLVSAVFVCVGQLLWKLSTQSIWYLVAGFGFYGVGALVMLVAYKFGSLSVLQPVLAVGYVLSLILGHLVVGEVITPVRALGVAVICAGVVFVASGDAPRTDAVADEPSSRTNPSGGDV